MKTSFIVANSARRAEQQRSTATLRWLLPMIFSFILFAVGGGQRVCAQQQAQSFFGFHFAIVCNDGSVQTWGDNTYGQLGYNTAPLSYSSTPTTLTNLSDVVAVSTADFHTIAVRCDGTVWTWGSNTDGQLGNGTAIGTNNLIPTQVPGINNAISVSGGHGHSVALLANGTILAWGRNIDGELGNGNFISSLTPVQVMGITNAIAIESYHYGNVALLQNGNTVAWGAHSAQLDGGPDGDSNVPITVNGLSDVVQITAGGNSVMARLNNGTLWAWGYI